MNHRVRNVTFAFGTVLVVAAVAFRMLAMPSLVRFPLNVDETAHYTGVALTYVDPATAAPLNPPRSEPLTVDHRVKVLSGTAHTALIAETITVTFGTTTSVESYQYVMDRRSMKLLDGPRQFAFGDPANAIHANDAFRVNWPMGTTAHAGYPSYIAQADATIPLTLVQGKHFHQNAGVTVVDFGSTTTHEVAPYYLAHLKAQGLPMQLTPAQVSTQLQASGVDITKALTDLAPNLTPAEQQVLSTALSQPVPLKYFYVVEGTISVEPRTGALVSVHANHEGIAAQPDLSASAALNGLLTKYATIPSVKAASDGLARLATQPPSVVEDLQYTQTPQSIGHLGSKARQQIRQLDLVQVQLPWGVGILGGVLLLVAAGFTVRRRSPDATAVEVPAEQTVRPAA